VGYVSRLLGVASSRLRTQLDLTVNPVYPEFLDFVPTGDPEYPLGASNELHEYSEVYDASDAEIAQW
jgi:hypothetical protein